MQTNILDWLEATSARCPDAPAVGDDQTDCTWAQLADTARRAGSFLASRTMPRRPVAFYLEKSVSAFAAMLGTVYAGCCYSVLDTRQPAARTLQVLDTLTPALLVTDEAHAAAAAALGYSGQIIRLDDLLAAPADAALLAARRRQAVDVDPLYINFTSGSTGVPKGVTVSHRSVLDFIPQFAEIFGITQNDILGNQAPFDFDVSVKDLYSAFKTGATLVLIPRKMASRQPEKWAYACIDPIYIITRLLAPLTGLVNLTAKGILFLFGVRNNTDENDVTEEEIINMVQEGHEQGVIQASEAEMISNIFEYGDKEAQDIMTHRGSIVAIDGETKLKDAIASMLGGKNSRYPVYEENIDHIIGILHLKDAMRFHISDDKLDLPIAKLDGLLREPYFVPQSMMRIRNTSRTVARANMSWKARLR